MNRVFIGYDSQEPLAYRVCRDSLLKHAASSTLVEPLLREKLRTAGIYRRSHYVRNGQPYDTVDDKPFSTEFSFTRFLVPALCQWQGWAVFCDNDFLWRDSVDTVFALADPAYACMVVKHNYRPAESTKLRKRLIQEPYPRKNWSSLILWNCEHPSTQMLTPYEVTMRPGAWLHQFKWLRDDEIGELPPEWNWLEGTSTEDDAAAVHYTRGCPDVPGFEHVAYADEWWAYTEQFKAAG